jgi:hypothetical protein
MPSQAKFTREQIEQIVAALMASFALFCCKIAKIYDADSNILAFNPNRYQRKLYGYIKNGYRKFQIHKSRQLGNSTAIAIYLFFVCMFTPRYRVLVMANTHENTKGLWEIYDRLVKHMPDWLRDYFGVESVDKLVRFKHGGYIKFFTAGSTEVTRGRTFQAAHFSEVAFWPDVDRAFAAAMGALSGSDPLIFLESTANGDNVWKEEWENNPAYEKLFFSWAKDTQLDVPEHDRARVDALETPKHILEISEAQGLLDGQVRWAKEKYWGRCRGNRLIFRQEYPTTAAEAFIASGDRVFEMYFQNVKWDEGEAIYEQPIDHVPYILGADPSGGGANGDYSPIVVIRADDLVRPKIVFTSYQKLTPLAFARQIHKVATKYRALVVVERNNYGLTVLEQLLQYNSEKYQLYTNRTIGKVGKTLKPNEVGFWSGEKSRAQLFAKLIDMLASGRIIPVDPRLQQEINTLVWKGGRPEHDDNAHDDMLVALGLALQGCADVGHDWKQDAIFSKKPRTLREVMQFRSATGLTMEEADGKFTDPADDDSWLDQWSGDEPDLSDSILGI